MRFSTNASWIARSAIAIFLLLGMHTLCAAVTPDQALENLTRGNARFASGRSIHPRLDTARRSDTFTNGQHPFATVIACSDSRVPPEILFDQGIGDVFTIRVAGNVIDIDETGSIEYGVDHLGTPVFVVLGHRNCGAVTAVVTNAQVHGSIPMLVDNIIPAVETAQRNNSHLRGKALVPAAVETNVFQSIEDLFRGSAVSRQRVRTGQLKVVGAVYDIETGKVEWLGSHPLQSSLLGQGEAAHGAVQYGAEQSHASRSSAQQVQLTDAGLGSLKYALGVLLFLAVLGGAIYAKARITDANGQPQTAFTVGARVLAGSGIVLAILVGLAVFVLTTLSNIGGEIDNIAEAEMPLMEMVSEIEMAQLEQAVVLERMIRFGEARDALSREQFEHHLAEFRKLAGEVDHKIEEGIAQLTGTPVHSEEEAQTVREVVTHLETIETEHQDFDNHVEELVSLLESGHYAEARELEEKIEAEVEALDHELEQFLRDVTMRIEAGIKTVEEHERTAASLFSMER